MSPNRKEHSLHAQGTMRHDTRGWCAPFVRGEDRGSREKKRDNVSRGWGVRREQEGEGDRGASRRGRALWDSHARARGTERARDKREGTDKRKRGHSGVTLPRVLLRFSSPAATDMRTFSPRARVRAEVLFIFVGLSPSPVHTHSRASARVRE